MVDITIGFPGSDNRDPNRKPSPPTAPLPSPPNHPNPQPHTSTNNESNPHTSDINGHNMHYSKWQKYFPVAHAFYTIAPKLSYQELCSLAALGLVIGGPAPIKASAGALLGVMEYGPIFDTAILEFFANESMLTAFMRAGVLGKAANTEKYTYSSSMLFKVKQHRDVMPEIQRHVLKNMGVKGVIEYAISRGLNTAPDSLLLWSGFGVKGVKISKEFAKKNGYTTLEMTPGGAWLDKINLYRKNSPFSKEERKYIFRRVSEEMIARASGQVNSIVGNVAPDSVYMAERKAALDNVKILGIDELQLFPRMIFK